MTSAVLFALVNMLGCLNCIECVLDYIKAGLNCKFRIYKLLTNVTWCHILGILHFMYGPGQCFQKSLIYYNLFMIRQVNL